MLCVPVKNKRWWLEHHSAILTPFEYMYSCSKGPELAPGNSILLFLSSPANDLFLTFTFYWAWLVTQLFCLFMVLFLKPPRVPAIGDFVYKLNNQVHKILRAGSAFQTGSIGFKWQQSWVSWLFLSSLFKSRTLFSLLLGTLWVNQLLYLETQLIRGPQHSIITYSAAVFVIVPKG